jgi:hypothetical protein
MGDVAMIIQLVVGFNASEPLLKTSRYSAKPTAPDIRKRGNDATPGKDFLCTISTPPKHIDAIAQRNSAKEEEE